MARLRLVLPCAFALLAFPLAGCNDAVQHTNPYDDQTPPELQAGGTVSGRVELEGETSHDKVVVSVPGSSGTAMTEADGAFALSGIPAGVRSLLFTREGFRQVRLTGIQVDLGQTVDVGTVQLSVGRGVVRGQVTLSDVTDFGGVVVSLQSGLPKAGEGGGKGGGAGDDAAVRAFAAVSTSSGYWEIGDVPLGQYFLLARKNGYQDVCAGQLTILKDGEQKAVGVLELVSTSALVRFATRGGVDLVSEEYAGSVRTFTSQRELKARILAAGAVAMRTGWSEAELASAAFVPFALESDVLLPEGADGDRTLRVELRDQCQLVQAYSGTVTLDTLPPDPASVVIAEGAAFLTAADGTAAVAFLAQDATSGVRQMKVSYDGSDPNDQLLADDYQEERVVPLGTDEGAKTVRAVFIDGAGNVSPIVEDTIVKDTLAPEPATPAITFDGVADGAAVRSLAVTLLFHFASEPPAQMVVSNVSGTEAGPWQPFASPLGWTLAAGGDGARTVYARFRDAAGNLTDEVEATVAADLTAPQPLRLSIAGGTEGYLRQQTGVQLDVEVDDPTAELELSNCQGFCAGASCDPCCHTLDWTPYAQAVTGGVYSGWSFAGCGEGLRQVYARFRDAAGNQSAVVQDSIFLDHTAPTGARVEIAGGADWLTAADGTAAVRFSASDSFSGVRKMSVTTDGSDPDPAALQDYVEELSLPLGSADGTKTVKALFVDLAGNVSAVASDTIVKDSTAPVPASPAITFAGLADGAVSNSPDVTLEFHFTGTELPAQMAVSNSSGTEGGPWQAFRASLPFTLAPRSDGAHAVYARFRDAAGNPTDEVQASLTLDLTPPASPLLLIAADARSVQGDAPQELTLLAEGASDLEISNCSDFCEGAGCDPCCQTRRLAYRRSVDDWSFAGCAEGLQTVFARFFDEAGNGADALDSVFVDRTAPAITAFAIGDGAPTRDLSVLLNLQVAGRASESLEVAFLNPPCTAARFATATFQPYSPFATFLLDPGDSATKTVCVQVRDDAGNVSAPPELPCDPAATPACATVFLDTQPPSPPVLSETRLGATASQLTLVSAPSDPAPSSGSLSFQMMGGLGLADWTAAPGPDFTFALDPSQTNNVLAVRVVDAAGNASTPTQVTVVYDVVAPLSAPYIDSGTARGGVITLHWTAVDDADVDHYLVYYGNFPKVGNGTFAAQGPSPVYVPKDKQELRLTNAGDLTTVYFQVSAVDGSGNEGPKSNEFALTVYDLSPRTLGFVGGKVHSSALLGQVLIRRTSLGLEAWDVSDAAQPALLARHYAPVTEPYVVSPTAGLIQGQMAAFGSSVFLLQRDQVEILELVRPATGKASFQARGSIAASGSRAAFVRAEGSAVRLYLAGTGTLSVYDVTRPGAPKALSSLDLSGVDADFAPTYLSVQDHDYAAGPRSILFAASSSLDQYSSRKDFFQAVDVTDPAAPAYLAQYPLGWETFTTVTASEDALLFSSGKRGSMKVWVEGVRFDGSAFSALCHATGTPGCDWGMGCGGGSGCDFYSYTEVPSSQPLAMQAFTDAAGRRRLALATYAPSLKILDVGDLDAPTLVAETAISATSIGTFGQLATGSDRLAFTGTLGSLAVSLSLDGTASAGGTAPGFALAPIHDPSGSYDRRLAVHSRDDQVYLAAYPPSSWSWPTPVNATHVLADFSSPALPELRHVDSSNAPPDAQGAYRAGQRVVLAEGAQRRLVSYDLADPATPAVAQWESSPGSYSDWSAYGEPLVEGDLVVSGGSAGVGFFRAAPPGEAPGFTWLGQCAPDAAHDFALVSFHKSRTNQYLYLVTTGTDWQQYLSQCQVQLSPFSCSCTTGASGLNWAPEKLLYRKAADEAGVLRPRFIYAAGQTFGVMSYDFASSTSQFLGTYHLDSAARKMLEVGNYVLVATDSDLQLLDLSNSRQIRLAGRLETGGVQCRDVFVEGTVLYCASDGLVAFQLAGADLPLMAGTGSDASQCYGFAANQGVGLGFFDMSADELGFVRVESFDLRDLSDPTVVASAKMLPRELPSSFEVYADGTGLWQLLQLEYGRTDFNRVTFYFDDTFPDLDNSGNNKGGIFLRSQPTTHIEMVPKHRAGWIDFLYVADEGSTALRADLPVTSSLGSNSTPFGPLCPAPAFCGNPPAQTCAFSFRSVATDPDRDGVYLVGKRDNAHVVYYGDYEKISNMDPALDPRDFPPRFPNDYSGATAFTYPQYSAYVATVAASAGECGANHCLATLASDRQQVALLETQLWTETENRCGYDEQIRHQRTVRRCSLTLGSGQISQIFLGSSALYVCGSEGSGGLGRYAIGSTASGGCDWPLTLGAQDAGGCNALFVDEAAGRAVVGGEGFLRVVDSATLATTLTLSYPGLGTVTNLRKAGDYLYAEFDTRELRRIDVSGGYDAAVDAQGYYELVTDSVSRAGVSNWVYHVASGPAVVAMEPFDSADAWFTGELTKNQYTPATGVLDASFGPGRIYACRARHPTEKTVFEVVGTATPATHPVVLGALAETAESGAIACSQVAVSDPLAWLVDGSAGTIHAVSLANETAPAWLSKLAIAGARGSPSGAVAHGRYLYVSFGQGQIQTYHLDAANQVEKVGEVALPGSGDVLGMAVAADRLYLSQKPSAFMIYDLSAPASPAPLSMLAVPAGKVSLAGPLGFVAPDYGGVRVIDLR